jgi:hypothetical protein
MDGVTLRHLLRPFAAQEAAAAGRAPEQLVTNPSTAQSGQPSRAGPSNELLAQVAGSYSSFGLAPDLKALFGKPSASSAADIIDLTRASPPGSAATATLPLHSRHGLTASSRNEQSSAGALFGNKSANGMGTFTGEGSAKQGTVLVSFGGNNGTLSTILVSQTDYSRQLQLVGISDGGIQFHDSSAYALQKLPFKSTTHHHPTLLGDRIRVACLNVGGFNLQRCYNLT